MFSDCTESFDSTKTELGSSDQEPSLSADKNTGAFLELCRTWNCVPKAISGGANISKVPGCHLLLQICYYTIGAS